MVLMAKPPQLASHAVLSVVDFSFRETPDIEIREMPIGRKACKANRSKGPKTQRLSIIQGPGSSITATRNLSLV